jgi:hypothetical protein
VIEIGIREVATRDRIAGVVELRTLSGFDSSLFESLAIEVAAQEQQVVPRGVLLVIKGLINPAGIGFAHFIGAVLIRAELRSTGRPSLVCEPQFITQAPPRVEGGYGIFGYAIETSAYGRYLEVWMYRAPLFNR